MCVQVELRLLVWTSRTEWAELWQRWSDTPFAQLDFATLEIVTAAFLKKLARMDKGLPSNQVRLVVSSGSFLASVTACRLHKLNHVLSRWTHAEFAMQCSTVRDSA